MDACDGGVGHQPERLALGLEARDDPSRIHAGLDELECHLTPDRLDLFGEPDFAHTALAELANQAIRTDGVARPREQRVEHGGLQFRQPAGIGVEQFQHALTERGVVRAEFEQAFGALRRRQFANGLEQVLRALVLLRRHASALRSSRSSSASQRCANASIEQSSVAGRQAGRSPR